MPVRYMGRNDKWFAENMGNGGTAISLPKRENSKSDTSVKPSQSQANGTQSEMSEEDKRDWEAMKKQIDKMFSEQSPATRFKEQNTTEGNMEQNNEVKIDK